MSRKKLNKSKFKYQTLRGFKDILPEHQKFWDFVLKNIKETAEDYSYQKIDTPILENAALFEHTVGKETDVVAKEMFTFEDKGGERVTLRPEMTASVARAYIEHGMLSWPQPVKLWSWGPVFRYDKPQAGRYRQFNQFNFEVIGSDASDIDAQVIIMASELYKSLGIEIEVQINSIGCPECRKEYIKLLKKYLRGQKMCSTCQERAIKNPLRVLDCKEEKCEENLAEAPQIIDSLCEECKNHFVKVLEILDDSEVIYNLNPFLVRGLDYYNRTTFEFYAIGDEQASQGALGGGGRYDYLIEQLGGRPAPAVGFAGGMERAILKIKESGREIRSETQGDVFIAQLGDDAKKKCVKLFKDLRKESIKVKEAFSKKGLTDQLEIANKMKVRYALILGQKEIMDDTIIIRDMDSGIQEIIAFDRIISEIKKRLLGNTDVKIYSNEDNKS
ncbi:histidine--tRNA ligase [Candidatus Parcubacteria bacterium]|nr:histidine--tRNA ligase [Patescibacteria group bacterium]MBU4482050.1 histidine--tRNA ligase [Patescibacteria group bacterium]MCG2687124.1 histidine--tRNA ligase [Candidatus Parcubacteria bacterium]